MIRLLASISIIRIFNYTFLFAQQNSLQTWLSSIMSGFGKFGYINKNISVKSISPTEIVFESPVILDESQKDVLKYVLWYGPFPFSKLLDGNSGVSTADYKSKEFVFTAHTGKTFTMNLVAGQDVIPNQIYYVTVIPIAQNGDSGEMSGPDICFRLQPTASAVGIQCNTLANNTHHSSAGANMALANISNTCNGNQITLTRTPVPGASQVRIYKVVNGEPDLLLATRNMNDASYTYTIPNPTPPEVVRFVPIDANGSIAGTQFDYTLRLCTAQQTPYTPDISTPQTPTRPAVTHVPKVGPKENILLVFVCAVLIYAIVQLVRYVSKKNQT